MPARLRRIATRLQAGTRRGASLLREAASNKTVAIFRVARRTPLPVRRLLAPPLASLAERTSDRRPTSVAWPQLAFIAGWSAGDMAQATTRARRTGTSLEAPERARRGLLALSLAAGLRDVAAEIADSLPDEDWPELELVRIRRAIDSGRYTDAVARGERALTRGVRAAQPLVERARGLLTALEPGWQPRVADLARVSSMQGQVSKGRILHVVAVSLPQRQSGYTLRTQSVASCQIEAGLDAHVLTRAGFPGSEGIHDAPPEEVVDRVPYHRVAPDFTSGGRTDRVIEETVAGALELVERLRPAALQPASNHPQAQVALALRRTLGIPVVYEVRGFWEESWAAHPTHDEDAARRTEHYLLTRAAETAAMQAADRVVTLSETMRSEIIERGCAPDNVVIVPNAVDIERFTPRPRDEALAATLGIETGEPVVGYISSLTAYEGLPYLLRAVATLRRAGRRVRLLLVGDGSEAESLRALGSELGLDEGTLIMPGRVPHDDVLRYYALIDVFVIPRTKHRVAQLVTPLKPYEAMAMERALVVSDVPALREMVIPGETGLTFRAEDADDLTEVLGHLLDDAALRARLGQRGREWVAEERTWTANGRRYRELYESLGVV